MNDRTIMWIITIIGIVILYFVVTKGGERRKAKRELAKECESFLVKFANTLFALNGPLLLQGTVKITGLAYKRRISDTDSTYERLIKKRGMTADRLYSFTIKLTDYLLQNPDMVKQLPASFFLFAYIDGEKNTIFEFVKTEEESGMQPHHTFLFCVSVDTSNYTNYAKKIQGHQTYMAEKTSERI